MRRVLCRLQLLVFLLPLVYCGARQISFDRPPVSQNVGQNQGPRRTVTGSVTNAVSGEPIRHALVQLSGSRSATVLTGPDGRFQITDVPEGPVSLSAQKPGFFDSRTMRGADGMQFNAFKVSSGKNDFQLRLLPAGRIEGKVTDRDGEPVKDIQVQVLAEQVLQGHKQWQARNASSTDDDGSYEVADLLPGRYIVFANGHTLPAQSWNAPREVSAPTYFPNAVDLASAQAIDIAPGQQFRADLQLRTERGFRITGQASGVPGAMGVGLSMQNASGQTVWFDGMSFDQSRGQFIAPTVPSGTWTLVLSANNGRGQMYEARQEIAVNHVDVSDVQIVLHPAMSIPVTINHPANQAPGAAQPNADRGPSVFATLTSLDAFNFQSYGTQPQGDPPALAFPNITAGKYRLDVQTYGKECLESAWYGSVDLLRDYMTVGSDGGGTQPITINLRADCATLTAKVRPGGHVPATGILLVVPGSSFAAPKVLPIVTQLPPEFSGMGLDAAVLSPGSYQVFAFSSLEGLEYANPEVLRGYPSQSVNLEPGQRAEVTVELSERKEN
jgi:hypothetical protein